MKEFYKITRDTFILLGTIVAMTYATSTVAVAGEGYRGFSIGVIANDADFETVGREEERGSVAIEATPAHDNNFSTVTRSVIYPSWFMEYTWGSDSPTGLSMTVGLEHINGKTAIGSGSRGDAQGASGIAENDTGTRAAKATVENVNTIYIEPGFMVNDWLGVYGKTGVTLMDINVEENNLPTSTYDNINDHPGAMLGLGIRMHSPWGVFVKLDTTKTWIKKVDLESLTGNLNRIKAKSEIEATRLSLGINF